MKTPLLEIEEIFTLFDIPDEILRTITGLLIVSDALSFQSTCKTMKNTISLGSMKRAIPRELQTFHISPPHDDSRKRWVEIDPILFRSDVHSMIFSCEYKDQGWGNKKGKIYITEKDDEFLANDVYDIGTVIAESPIAKHHMKSLVLKFRPKPGSRYAICYKVGGGGGHELFITNAKVRSAVYLPCIELANEILVGSPFLTRVVRAVLETVQEEGRNVEDLGRFLEVFEPIGVDLRNERHVEGVRRILQEFLVMQEAIATSISNELRSSELDDKSIDSERYG